METYATLPLLIALWILPWVVFLSFRKSYSFVPVFLQVAFSWGLFVLIPFFSPVERNSLVPERPLMLSLIIPSGFAAFHFFRWMGAKTAHLHRPPPDAWKFVIPAGLVLDTVSLFLFSLPFTIPYFIWGILEIFFLFFFMKGIKASEYVHAFLGTVVMAVAWIFSSLSLRWYYRDAGILFQLISLQELLYTFILPTVMCLVMIYILKSRDPEDHGPQFHKEEEKNDFFR